MTGPADLVLAASKVHQYSILSAPTMGQYAALEAVLNGEESVQAMVADYDRRRKFLVQGFNDLGLPTIEPKGAFYAFPYVGRFGLTSKEFCQQLLREAKVAIIPGSAFGQGGEGYARVCYATSMQEIEEALVRMEKFLYDKGWLEKVNVQAGVPHYVRVEQLAAHPDQPIG
jgi:aminotransferase